MDTICKDLGINSRRKGNFIKELLQPYKPEDFNGFIDEYLQKQNKNQIRDPKANGSGMANGSAVANGSEIAKQSS